MTCSILRFALTLALALPAVAFAAVLNVDTTLDDVTKSMCDDAVDGDLVSEVVNANAAGALDTIVVPAGTYTFSNASPCTF